jgi:hypothetical protein
VKGKPQGSEVLFEVILKVRVGSIVMFPGLSQGGDPNLRPFVVVFSIHPVKFAVCRTTMRQAVKGE